MAGHSYDLAFSFAGEQRDYVVRTVEACKKLGLRVFYDKDKNNEWWGGNFIRQQRSVYSSQTRYFVPFISAEYLTKPIPMDEFSSAMMTAVKQGDGYILPVLMDDVHVPPDLLHPHIHYLRAQDYSPEELASELQRKLSQATGSGQQPMDLGPVVERALSVRLPKIIPSDWSKYAELDRIFGYLAGRFNDGVAQLRAQGLPGHVRVRDDSLFVRVERSGDTIAGLDLRKNDRFGDDKITWSIGYRNLSSGINGWVTPTFDKERGMTVLDIQDFSMTHHGGSAENGTEEALFSFLWDKLIEQIER